jgi:hypothetical protein
MTAKKAEVRRAAGAALALVLALVAVGSVAAATARDRTPPTTPTNLRVTSLSHKSVTLAWDPVHGQLGELLLLRQQGRPWLHRAADADDLHDRLAGIDRDFVYGTAHGDNTFTVKAVDRAGNTSEASNPFTAFLWPC